MGTAGEGADRTGNPGDAKGAGWKPGKEEGSVGVAAAAGCSEAGVPSPAMEAGDPKARPGWGVAAAGDGATDGAAALGLWATKPAACRGTEANSATPAEYRSKTCIERCTGMCTWKFFQSTQQMRRPSNSHDSLDPLGPMQIPLDHRLDRPPGPFIAFGSGIRNSYLHRPFLPKQREERERPWAIWRASISPWDSGLNPLRKTRIQNVSAERPAAHRRQVSTKFLPGVLTEAARRGLRPCWSSILRY